MKTAARTAILFLFFFSPILNAQSNDESWKLYDDSQVALIEVTMVPTDYTWMMNNPMSDSLQQCTVRIVTKYFDETVEQVGIGIRGNTSRTALKKSFKISFNDFMPGREFYGVDKINLNGEHNDPSIARAKICWDIFQDIGMPASRAAHAAVYINNVYHGLYISVEHIDDEFLKKNFDDDTGNLWKCLYPADLAFISNNPDSYKYYSWERQPYALTNNLETNDYAPLANLIRIINKTTLAEFPDSLESILFIDEFLKYIAINVMVGCWDDYWANKNNYYLYYEPAQKKFHWIPYDYDNTLGISWMNTDWTTADPYNFPKLYKGESPLADRMLKVPEYRNLYTHFVEFLRNKILNVTHLYLEIDHLKNMIDDFAANDTYRTRDYGFTINDFYSSFTGINKLHVHNGIIDFIDKRYKAIPVSINYVDADPIVYKIDYEPKNPAPGDSVYVYASGFDEDGIESMTIKFFPDVQTIADDYVMSFKPLASTKIEDTDRWVGVIPPVNTNGKFQVEIKDSSGNSVLFPRIGSVEIETSASAVNSIVINEFMADNVSFITDPAGEYDDWVELYNPTQDTISLHGMFLTDIRKNHTKWMFADSNLVLNPGGHLIVWCDENHNDNQPGIHANFKLSSSGEFIGLTARDSTTWLDSLSFGQQTSDYSFGRSPDGSSRWGFLTPTPGAANSTTDVEEDETLPAEFKVAVYPNPFNPATTIQYSLPKFSDVSITVYDILGRVVWTFNETGKAAGTYSKIWNSTNNNGTRVGSGIYLCRISAGEYLSIRKLVMMK